MADIVKCMTASRNLVPDTTIAKMAIAFVVLNLADCITTNAALNLGGYEINPLFSSFNTSRADILIGLGAKMIVTSIAVLMLIEIYFVQSFGRHEKTKRIFVVSTLIFLDAAMIGIVINNMAVIAYLANAASPAGLSYM